MSATAPARAGERARDLERGVLLAGVDEAGLGPLLGPLTIGWCALRVPSVSTSPWKLLGRAVARSTRRDRTRLIVDDSKVVFARNERGRRRLEATALSFLSCLRPDGRPPSDAAELLFGPLRPSRAALARHPWYERLPALPAEHGAETIELRAALLAREMARAGVALVDAGVRVVPSGELNRSLERTENKAATAWLRTREVLRHIWKETGAEHPRVTVDLLGGRFHYGPLLARGFPDAGVRLERERRHHASYVLEGKGEASGRRMSLVFRKEGERHSFAVALASCIAKYARETVMRGFNDFFAELDPSLRPTAGYRNDAQRWLRDAAETLNRCGVPRDLLIRRR